MFAQTNKVEVISNEEGMKLVVNGEDFIKTRFNGKTRWLIIADNELELFWEIDKYQSPWDTKYCEIKNKSISLGLPI